MKKIDETLATGAGHRRSMSLSALAWSGYQGGRDPYITLVSIYIFIPYVATVMVGDPVKGQAMIAGFAMLGGLIAALTAPLLGAAADRMGRRLPPLFLLALLFAPLVFSLWWARPDGSGLSVHVFSSLCCSSHWCLPIAKFFTTRRFRMRRKAHSTPPPCRALRWQSATSCPSPH